MSRTTRLSLLLLTLCSASSAPPVDKLADAKLCADKECAYTISVARANEDFAAPDCRFINLKKGQMIYIYSKLLPKEGAGVFWSGSVYSDRYVDQMGVIGYFPRNLVTEIHVYNEDPIKVATTDVDFYCI
ncbi:otoraplin-like [Scleropages formosus]|uniref:Otoraplin n=1 Tax=Scleropages formosus TaxID=113540 RepID=A0A8C9RD50_SCLFO|nr:otoraplin [Scleropages formosus]